MFRFLLDFVLYKIKFLFVFFNIFKSLKTERQYVYENCNQVKNLLYFFWCECKFYLFLFYFCFKVRGHNRVPSDSKEFHEVTKRDAQSQLDHELDKLLQTASPEDRPLLKEQLNNFSSLFSRFIQEEGPSLDWNNIQKLPEDAVQDYRKLQAPDADSVSNVT